jgi:ectoine hydroxylase
MELTQEQVLAYRQDGYLLLPKLFNQHEIRLMMVEMREIIKEDCPRRIMEKNGAIRSFFAPDFTSQLFHEVSRLHRLVKSARQLLGSDVYIHQTKLNTKHAMVGDWWDWHQDYTFWKQDDGMPAPEVLTAMIYLNDVNEFNGPLLLVPGSHVAGTLDDKENPVLTSDGPAGWFGYQRSTTYMSALTADLKYTIKPESIARWIDKNGIFSAKGPAGTVLFFHGNVFHASSNNLSPWDRHTFLITYNSVDNALPESTNPRPEFIAQRDFRPIQALNDTLKFDLK